jgi:hypothetical protein
MADDPRAFIRENVITGIQWLSEHNILYKKLLHKSSIHNHFKYHNSISVNRDNLMPVHENVGMLDRQFLSLCYIESYLIDHQIQCET